MAAVDDDPAQLVIAPQRDIMEEVDDLPVLISIRPPSTPGGGRKRMPSDIVCVLDVSWSMTMQTQVAGTRESSGLSMLDIAKHALKTVINTLDDHDRIAVVTFAKDARTIVHFTKMDEDGHRAATNELDKAEYDANTNLWQGFKVALELLKSRPPEECKNKLSHILVLTDGEAEDKAEVLPNLQKYSGEHGGLPGSICMFGFGYEIDSPLLMRVANEFGGSYAFIPDAGFVGTCFVNCISNLLATMARGATLSLTTGSGSNVKSIMAGNTRSNLVSDNPILVEIGNLQYGQSRDIVVMMKARPGADVLTVRLEYKCAFHDAIKNITQADMNPAGQGLALEPHLARGLALIAFRNVLSILPEGKLEPRADDRMAEAKDEITNAITEVKKLGAGPAIQALLQDLEGQCAEAVMKVEHWNKWGRHYLPSITSAHAMQQCNNFKDPGVQVYGSENPIIEEIRDVADEFFNKIPPPRVKTAPKWRYFRPGPGGMVRNTEDKIKKFLEDEAKDAAAKEDRVRSQQIEESRRAEAAARAASGSTGTAAPAPLVQNMSAMNNISAA